MLGLVGVNDQQLIASLVSVFDGILSLAVLGWALTRCHAEKAEQAAEHRQFVQKMLDLMSERLRDERADGG